MNRQYQQAHERYPGIPSAALRAEFAHLAPEVLAFCSVLGDILIDIYMAASDEEREAMLRPPENMSEDELPSTSTQMPIVTPAKTTPKRGTSTRTRVSTAK